MKVRHIFCQITECRLFKFMLIGMLNTVISAVIMFFLYHVICMGYWSSSSIAYLIGGMISYGLNKKYTFQNHNSIKQTGLKFVINIVICFVAAYSLAQPCVSHILSGLELKTDVIEQVSMLFGMAVFTVLNYLGQRFFAFNQL